MKMKNVLMALFILLSSIAYSQTVILPDSMLFEGNGFDSTKPKVVLLYEAGFQYDTLFSVSFSWFDNHGNLKIGNGQLVQVFKMFSKEYSIIGREVLVHDEYYIRGDDGKKYYLNGVMLDNIIMDSKRIPVPNWWDKLLGNTPRIVWEMRLLKENVSPKSQ